MTPPTDTSTPLSDAHSAAIDNIEKSVLTIAKNDSLRGFLPVIDSALASLASNQAGLAGVVAAANAVGPALGAEAPQVGAQIVKDEAATLKTGIDAAAAKAETTPGA